MRAEKEVEIFFEGTSAKGIPQEVKGSYVILKDAINPIIAYEGRVRMSGEMASGVQIKISKISAIK